MAELPAIATKSNGFPEINRLKQCRHGLMLYNVHDTYIGRSLDRYGEFSESETKLLKQFLRPEEVVIEVGANIGAHTVWMAQAVGPKGKVLAFEPQRIVYQTLCANVALNHLTNVYCYLSAAGKSEGEIIVHPLDFTQDNNFGGLALGSFKKGEKVPVLTLDGLQLSRCELMKIDAEGMELDVLEGAVKTIAAHAPILYVENDRADKSEALIRFIHSLGYNLFWHRPPYFSPDNFAGNPENIFGNTVSLNMLCLPKKALPRLEGLQLSAELGLVPVRI